MKLKMIWGVLMEIKVWLTIMVWLLRKCLAYIRVASPGVMHNCLTAIRFIRSHPHKGGHTQRSG